MLFGIPSKLSTILLRLPRFGSWPWNSPGRPVYITTSDAGNSRSIIFVCPIWPIYRATNLSSSGSVSIWSNQRSVRSLSSYAGQNSTLDLDCWKASATFDSASQFARRVACPFFLCDATNSLSHPRTGRRPNRSRSPYQRPFGSFNSQTGRCSGVLFCPRPYFRRIPASPWNYLGCSGVDAADCCSFWIISSL